MNRLHDIERWASRILEVVVTLFFFGMVVLTILLVVLRYVFTTTIVGGNEATQFLFIYTTALGAAISLGKQQHIRIYTFVEKLPARGRQIVNIINSMLIIALHVYLFILSLRWISQVGYFESPVLTIPQGIVQICIPLSCIFVVLFSIRHILSEVLQIGGKAQE
jgi:TRAP-type C4-dicarboxylate transport system permease small subunit